MIGIVYIYSKWESKTKSKGWKGNFTMKTIIGVRMGILGQIQIIIK